MDVTDDGGSTDNSVESPMTQHQAPLEPPTGRAAANPSFAAHVAVWLALVVFLVALALMAWGVSSG